VLPGVRLGYLMCDTCSDATKALQNVEYMLSVNGSLNIQCNYTDFRPPVKAMLGARFSEVSIAVARLLSLYMVPQVSCTSSSPALSDKLRFPVFLRTVPSDVHQTKALAKLMKRFDWNWVGVVYGDDDYGKAAFQSFLQDAEEMDVCLEYQEMVPHYLDHNHSMPRIKQVAKKIRSSTAQVVLLILKPELVEDLFKEMILTNTSKTWIASDAWSRNRPLAHMDGINSVGDIFGFTFVARKSESFDNYLKNLNPSLDTSETYNQRVAVWAVVYALKNLLQCNDSSCSGETNFPPWKRYQMTNVRFCFLCLLAQIPQSRCTESCRPGTEKKILNVSCCYTCMPCEEGTFADEWGTSLCPNDTWSLVGWTQCKPREESFLRWGEPYPITLVVSAAFGILLLLVIFIIFWVYRESAPMKRAEVTLSSVMMAGLAVSFASVICFMGKPDVHLCRARQMMYALGFTLCVSCILVKAFRTFLAFLPFGQLTHRGLGKLYMPPVIVTVLTALQGVICILWLIFDSPSIDNTPPSAQSMEKIIQCNVGHRYIGFGIMLSYIALLAFIGFLLAFKGRKVPQEFSETGYIIFSMLMYLFVWVCFIPIYIIKTGEGPYVQASAILVSNYGVIFCHFLPKCYEFEPGRLARLTKQLMVVHRKSDRKSVWEQTAQHEISDLRLLHNIPANQS
uniref:Olfactory receptor C family, b1 n=1 Tax=Myripristis murdjan TaxID=586833 RepID=A0A667YV16_9TELE